MCLSNLYFVFMSTLYIAQVVCFLLWSTSWLPFKPHSAVFTSSVNLSDVILEVSFWYQNFVTKESNTFVGNVANNFLRRKDLLDIKGQYMKESITLAGECGKQFSHKEGRCCKPPKGITWRNLILRRSLRKTKLWPLVSLLNKSPLAMSPLQR